jgi:hypothetical protein
MEQAMADPLAEAARELISTLESHGLIVDTRLEARGRAAYLPAMSMNYGPPGAGEQSLTPREFAIDIASDLKSDLKNLQRAIKHSRGAEEIARIITTISACVGQSSYAHPRVERSLIEALESSIRRRETTQRVSAASESEEPPVICSQAALARYLDRSPNTANLLTILAHQGVILNFEAPAKRGGKYKVWFSNPDMHRAALTKLSCKTSKRPASTVNRRKASNSVE